VRLLIVTISGTEAFADTRAFYRKAGADKVIFRKSLD
jgi:hypothetical protein